MDVRLEAGKVAAVTGAASGIGFALAERFATSGMRVVLADVDETALAAAEERIGAHGVETLAVRADVSDEAAVQALVAATLDRMGAAHVVCNNAGVAANADPWFGPRSAWEWVLGVNLWGVIHGVRAFLPALVTQREGHIVNTASIAGLLPGTTPPYDASKHAVVALTEDLYIAMRQARLPIGVSVLCPGWVRTNIMDADRNWPSELGDVPAAPAGSDVIRARVKSAVDEGTPPAVIAEQVADAITADRFWVLPHPEWVDIAVRRWHDIAEGANPRLAADLPGFPPAAPIAREI